MAKFVIHAVRMEGAELVKLHYDSEISSLTWDNGLSVVPVKPKKYEDAFVVSEDNPAGKHDVTTLKIALGLACNYSCSYCNQRHTGDIGVNPDWEKFVANLPSWFDINRENVIVEFWGGEPLVYIKTLKPLAETLRRMMPKAKFSMITNGSLLNPETNEWLDRMGFFVSVSHDGPGQATRGPDPLENEKSNAGIRDLYARLHPKKRMSLNSMVHKENASRKDIVEFFQGRFGRDVRIGEGGVIDIHDNYAATLSPVAPSAPKLVQIGGTGSIASVSSKQYIRQSFLELAPMYRSLNINRRVTAFMNTIFNARPSSAVGQRCGMDKPDRIAVDLQGNVVTCQNVQASSMAPNGNPHLIGHVSELDKVKLNTGTHWSKRTECKNCPVLQMCQGACMMLEGEFWEHTCNAAYADNLPFFVMAIKFLTGCIPIYIEGPQRNDRHEIFGGIEESVQFLKDNKVVNDGNNAYNLNNPT